MICPRCSSYQIKKDGTNKTAQIFQCKSCQRHFSVPMENIQLDSSLIEPGKVYEHKSDETIRVHGLTDIHLGANEFDLDKFREVIKMIYEDDNALWFGNGDILECIPPNYKISQRGQYINPEEQHLAFMDLIAPIIDKCLFVRGGNHDYLRSVRLLDYDVSRIIAKEMGVPYYRLPGYSIITVGGKKWYLVSGHGKSGAKNGDLELDKLSSIYSQGDIFFLGHNHQLYAKPIDSIKVENDEETLHRRWYIRGGSFLRYAEYARYSLYTIVRTGWVTIELSKDSVKCWTN
jgi:predicted phosphodiesterase